MSITGEDRVEVREEPAYAIPPDTFGNRIMLARHMRGLSIREAADLCDIGRGAWTNWERGARPIDVLDHVEVISERLQIDREWLLYGGPLAKPATRRDRRDRRGGGSLTRRYVTLLERGNPSGPTILTTGSSGIGQRSSQRPRDTRPPGQPMISPRRGEPDLRRAA